MDGAMRTPSQHTILANLKRQHLWEDSFCVLREVVAAMRSSKFEIRWPLCWSYVS